MANMSISVSEGLCTITLDTNDWSSLSVDGESIQATASGWSYTQTSPGTLTFVAQATNLNFINPNEAMLLSGTNNAHLAVLEYSTLADGTNQIDGTFMSWPGPISCQSGSGPLLFSQGSMTGNFTEAALPVWAGGV